MSKDKSEKYEPIIKLNPFTFTLLIVGVIMLIALVFAIKAWSDNLRNDKRMTIDNLSSKVSGITKSASVHVQKALYDTVRANTPYDQDVPTGGAHIRDQIQVQSSTNNETNVHYAKFVVDIESVKQSYDIQVEWVEDAAYRKNLSGYPVVISCVDSSAVIYEEFECTDMQSTSSDYGGGTLVTAHNVANIVNFTKLKTFGMSQLMYDKLYLLTTEYFTAVYGSESNLSLDKDSFKHKGTTFEYDLISLQKDKYHFIVDTKDDKLAFKITKGGDEIYKYDGTGLVAPKKNPNSIKNRYLPYRGQTASGIDYTFRIRADDKFEISVNSCHNQEIKDEARAATAEWLAKHGYDINDFEIQIPEYCDREQ